MARNNKSMSDVTVGIKTFMRPEALKRCLRSLRGYDWCKVIVADDSHADFNKEYSRVYAEFSLQLPLHVLGLPFDTGLSQGRNSIVQACTSKYLLMLDDDQSINSSVRTLLDVMEEDPQIGGVSCLWLDKGRFRCTACNIGEREGYIIKELQNKPCIYRTANGCRYAYFDFIPNSTLFRKRCLDALAWDPFYKIGAEHIDFFLSHKHKTNWKFTICMDTYIDHFPYINNAAYKPWRSGNRVASSNEYFRKKFGVCGIIKTGCFIEKSKADHSDSGVKIKYLSGYKYFGEVWIMLIKWKSYLEYKLHELRKSIVQILWRKL